MEAPCEAILYDFDGTLLDSLPGIQAAASAAVELLNPAWTLPDLKPLIGPPLRGMLELALPQATPLHIDDLIGKFRELYDGGLCLRCNLYAHVESTLRNVHRDPLSPRAFIVTNKRLLPTRQLLKHFEIADLFEAVVASDSPLNFDSKNSAVEWTLCEYGLTPAHCIFVGDSKDDYLAAKANGLQFVPVSYGYGEAAILSDQQSIQSFQDLPNWMEKHFISHL